MMLLNLELKRRERAMTFALVLQHFGTFFFIIRYFLHLNVQNWASAMLKYFVTVFLVRGETVRLII